MNKMGVFMIPLTGAQRKYLRGLANPLKPTIMIGKNGLSDQVFAAIGSALDSHELIKVKFLEFKEEKKDLAHTIELKMQCEMAGMIGHVAIFYRPKKEQAERQITLP
jgi:RNA-binding protein